MFTRFICEATCTETTPILSQQIVVADADGGNETVVVSEPGDTVYAFLGASWSPDGRSMIFARNTCGSETEGGPSGIWTVNPDGTGLAELARAPADACFGQGPTFTPDGLRIVAQMTEEGSGGSLWIMNRDGTELPPPDPQHRPEPRMSHRRCHPTERGSSSVGARLGIANRPHWHRRHRRREPAALPTSQLAGSGAPNWSPDSQTIVFSLSNGVTSDIATISADGSGLMQLTLNDPARRQLAGQVFAGRGKDRLRLSRYREGEVVLDELFTMSVDGSDVTQVTRTPDQEFSPRWAVATVD